MNLRLKSTVRNKYWIIFCLLFFLWSSLSFAQESGQGNSIDDFDEIQFEEFDFSGLEADLNLDESELYALIEKGMVSTAYMLLIMEALQGSMKLLIIK